MKYLLLHVIDEAAPTTSEQDEEIGASLAAWLEETIPTGVNLGGSRLQPVSDATTVRVRDGELLLSDGPFTETKEQIGGYDVLECADLDEAVAIAARHPTARLGCIEVRPFVAP